MKIHELKSWPQFFVKVITGEKTFEVRLNDRDFQVGDFLFLREWDPETKRYSGRLQYARITYIFGKDDQQSMQVLDSRYVVLGISLYWSAPAQILPGQEVVSARPEPDCPHDPSCSPVERLIKNGFADMSNWGSCFREAAEKSCIYDRVASIRTKSGFLALLFKDQVEAVQKFVETELANTSRID